MSPLVGPTACSIACRWTSISNTMTRSAMKHDVITRACSLRFAWTDTPQKIAARMTTFAALKADAGIMRAPASGENAGFEVHGLAGEAGGVGRCEPANEVRDLGRLEGAPERDRFHRLPFRLADSDALGFAHE